MGSIWTKEDVYTQEEALIVEIMKKGEIKFDDIPGIKTEKVYYAALVQNRICFSVIPKELFSKRMCQLIIDNLPHWETLLQYIPKDWQDIYYPLAVASGLKNLNIVPKKYLTETAIQRRMYTWEPYHGKFHECCPTEFLNDNMAQKLLKRSISFHDDAYWAWWQEFTMSELTFVKILALGSQILVAPKIKNDALKTDDISQHQFKEGVNDNCTVTLVIVPKYSSNKEEEKHRDPAKYVCQVTMTDPKYYKPETAGTVTIHKNSTISLSKCHLFASKPF